MKKIILVLGLTLALTAAVPATVIFTGDWSVNSAAGTIPDNSSVGITAQQAMGAAYNGDGNSGISDVEVRLTISGGYNGDLYGYLMFDNGTSAQTTVLLNRVSGIGVAGASGFDNITLSDAGTGGSIQSTVTATGGSYTAYHTLDTTADSAGGFGGMNVSGGGTWTLFLADLSAGDQSQLVSWGLNVSVVPEPVTYALGIFGGAMALLVLGCRIARQN